MWAILSQDSAVCAKVQRLDTEQPYIPVNIVVNLKLKKSSIRRIERPDVWTQPVKPAVSHRTVRGRWVLQMHSTGSFITNRKVGAVYVIAAFTRRDIKPFALTMIMPPERSEGCSVTIVMALLVCFEMTRQLLDELPNGWKVQSDPQSNLSQMRKAVSSHRQNARR